ncbi:MAG: diguanylate cyclase [Actinomycetales bacterium]|nr:diguanylate cyclase [Actinomycetales bacterium]
MDPLSFFVAVGLSYGALAVLLVVSDRPQARSATGLLAIGYAGVAVGVLLQGFAGALPVWLGAVLGNLLAWLGLLVQGEAIMAMSGRSLGRRVLVVCGFGVMGVSVLALLASPAWRFALGNLAYAVLFALSGWALMSWRDAPGALRRLASALFLASSVLYVVRAVEYLRGTLIPTFDRTVVPTDWNSALLYPLIFTSLLAGAFSVLLILRVSVERRLQEASAQLGRLAAYDDLTEMPNRRSLLERARSECARSDRGGRPLTVAVIDLDRLKLINDSYGHAAGDDALMRVAAACRATFRDDDTAARMGGDEFAVLLSDSDLAQGCAALRRMLATLGAEPLAVGAYSVALTASVGVAEYRRGEDLDDLLARADRAMYQSKQRGGGCVEAASDPADPVPARSDQDA